MKIKGAYYMRQMPTKIGIRLLDGRVATADLTPFREISEKDLTSLVISEQRLSQNDPIPGYVLRFYGLEKVDQ